MELPSLFAISDYIDSHTADSRQCIFAGTDGAVAKREWEKLKSVSLFIPAPFSYVSVEQYDLEETDLNNFVGFVSSKKVAKISNIDFYTREELDDLIKAIKLDQLTRELAEKQKTEEKNNGKRRR